MPDTQDAAPLDLELLRKALNEMSAAFGDRAKHTDGSTGLLADDLRYASAQCRALRAALSGLVEAAALLDRTENYVLANRGHEISLGTISGRPWASVWRSDESRHDALGDSPRGALTNLLADLPAAPALREEGDRG